MSADVLSNTATTTSTSTWTSAELPTSTTTTSTTPVSSSSTTTSMSLTPLLPSLPTPIPLLPSFPSPTSTMSTPTSTTTTSITITPTTIITTTTTLSTTNATPTSTPPTLIPTSIPPTVIPTTTPTITVIPPTTSVSPTSSSASEPSTSSVTSRTSSGTSSTGGSPTPSATPAPTTPVVSTSRSGANPPPTPEAMISSPRSIGPVSTFSSTVWISTTDVRGSSTIYAPPIITSKSTFMGPNNTPTTSTTIIANPTLNPDTSSPSSFFQNRGAVAGVFTLVGFAVISITLWIVFFVRRRRREIRFEHDTAVSASLTAAGFNRTPLEDEYDSRSSSAEFLAIPMANPDSERHRRSTSRLLEHNNGRMSIMPDAYHEDRGPYIEYTFRNSQDGYRDMPSPTTHHLNAPWPPPSAFAPYRDRGSSDGMGMVEVGNGLPMGAGIALTHHSHHSSGASLEPLLAPRNGRGPLVLATNNLSNGRASRTPSTENGSNSASTSKPSYLPSLMQTNFYGTNTSSRSAVFANGREEPQGLVNGSEGNLVCPTGMTTKLNGDVLGGDSEVSTAEDEDLKKPVLAVRNLPDAASTLSLS